MKEALTSKFFWSGFFFVLGIFLLLMAFNVLYTKADMQAQMDAFQKIVKSSADKDETSKQFYDNFFVKEVPTSFYIPEK